MIGLGLRRTHTPPVCSTVFSCFLVVLTQFTLAMIPRYLPSLSLLAMLPVSVLVWGATIAVGRGLRWLFGVSALAPALVLFNILFLWGVYVAVVRRVVPSLLDAIFNGVCALLLFGHYRILSGDPGLVGCESSCLTTLEQNDSETQLQYENSQLFSRVRYCESCKATIKGLDHHCYAYGNCIGSQKNHRLFMALVSGFILAEASYTMCTTKFITDLLSTKNVRLEGNISSNLVISTMLFSVQQLLWQIYWKKYPEFQTIVQPHPGSPRTEIKFTNPFDKGIIGNIKDFLKMKE